MTHSLWILSLFCNLRCKGGNLVCVNGGESLKLSSALCIWLEHGEFDKLFGDGISHSQNRGCFDNLTASIVVGLKRDL